MSIRTIVVILLALTCGGAASVGVVQLRSSSKQQPAEVETVPVLIAKVDVPRGSVLSADQLKIEQWPMGFAPEGALQNEEEAIDRTCTLRLVKGEPILQPKLAAKDAGRGLAAMIPTGMRAFTIQASHIAAGVGGFVMPGNHVDILLTTTGNSQDASGGASTTTLLQNVQILAVAQLLDAPDENKVDPKVVRDVTLLVTPDQAAKLDLGMNKGLLHLSLRNPEDHSQADTRPATLAQLRYHEEDANPPAGAALLKALSSVAKAVANAKPTPVAAAKSGRRREARIQTLRGMNQGVIRVELARSYE